MLYLADAHSVTGHPGSGGVSHASCQEGYALHLHFGRHTHRWVHAFPLGTHLPCLCVRAWPVEAAHLCGHLSCPSRCASFLLFSHFPDICWSTLQVQEPVSGDALCNRETSKAVHHTVKLVNEFLICLQSGMGNLPGLEIM